MRVIVFDTETTGLPKARNCVLSPKTTDNWGHIVQLSWVCFEPSVADHSVRNFIIRLPNDMEIPEETTKIHGITTQMSREMGEPIFNVLGEFLADLKAADYVVAHNIEFDRTMVLAELLRNNMISDLATQNPFERKGLVQYCTANYGKEVTRIPMKGYSKSCAFKFPKLHELYAFLFPKESKDATNYHNALVDTIICARCFCEMTDLCDLYVEHPNFRSMAGAS